MGWLCGTCSILRTLQYTDTVNAEKSWTFPKKKLDIIPKKVGHHPKKSWTFPKNM